MNKILDLYNKWCSIPDKIRFLFVGGVNAGFSYIIFAIALYLIGSEHYQMCVALQWIISSVFSFVNQKVFVFCTKGNWLKEYFKCCTTWIISYACNALILQYSWHQSSHTCYLSILLSNIKELSSNPC